MKWYCGPDWYECACARARIWHREHAHLLEFHPYFAWRPIRIGENRVWLEWIERKGISWGNVDTGAAKGIMEWKYRMPPAREAMGK